VFLAHKNPGPSNDSLAPVSAATSINKSIPVVTNRINRGQLAVRHGDLDSGRVEVIKWSSFVNSIQSKFLHMGFVRQTSFRRSSVCELL
jgi:hypothetical protein